MIYLASASPRRHELLCQAGILHEVLHVPSPPGEDEPRLSQETPHDYVLRTAHEKALRALHWLGRDVDAAEPAWPRSDQRRPLKALLTADTTVILGDDILGKPVDTADAANMLRRLSGTRHEVHTAIVVAVPGSPGTPDKLYDDVSRTEVKFADLTEEQISVYCASGEPMGKAGAYGIQGRAAAFVEYIRGSYTAVVGLPLYETARLLKRAGIKL
ncbi:Maf family protein [Pusillimonas sp.]|uniref:Maf family protein n=1 Tax=Pusillimonas sp. TaxID=3040095 RepID=UPI0037C60F74